MVEHVQESFVDLFRRQLDRTSKWLGVGRFWGQCGARGSDSRGRTYSRDEFASVHFSITPCDWSASG